MKPYPQEKGQLEFRFYPAPVLSVLNSAEKVAERNLPDARAGERRDITCPALSQLRERPAVLRLGLPQAAASDISSTPSGSYSEPAECSLQTGMAKFCCLLSFQTLAALLVAFKHSQKSSPACTVLTVVLEEIKGFLTWPRTNPWGLYLAFQHFRKPRVELSTWFIDTCYHGDLMSLIWGPRTDKLSAQQTL